jgi:tetratricopeptide (TPR) repeat protein
VAGLARDPVVLSIEADLYTTLGTIYADLQANYSEAVRAYQRSTDLRQLAGDLPGLTRSYNNLARTAWGQGNLKEAGDYLQRSLEISQRIGDNYMLALNDNNLGAISYAVGDAEQALNYYRAALSLRQRIGDNYGVAQTCSNIGEAHLSLEQYDEARRHLERSATVFEAIQSERELPEVYWLLAEVELARDDVASALDYAGRARDIAATIGNSELQGIAERVLAQGRARAGDVARARQSFDASIELLRASGNQIELARSHYEFGRLLVGQGGQEELACYHLRQATDLFTAAGAEKEAAQARATLVERDM